MFHLWPHWRLRRQQTWRRIERVSLVSMDDQRMMDNFTQYKKYQKVKSSKFQKTTARYNQMSTRPCRIPFWSQGDGEVEIAKDKLSPCLCVDYASRQSALKIDLLYTSKTCACIFIWIYHLICRYEHRCNIVVSKYTYTFTMACEARKIPLSH